MNLTVVLVIIALIALGYVISTYNAFQTIKTRIKASIQEIGNQLKRQADLIPNLEASVKGYLKHEKSIFDKLTEARKSVVDAVKSGSLNSANTAAGKLNQLIPALQVVVESNPELKANTTVTGLMDELRDTSDKVMYSRRTLIDLTADYNQMLVTFPSNMVGNIFGMKEEKGLEMPESGEFLKVSVTETKTPGIKLE
ncbi:LemA family protein [Candidatus Collierbacteria bacterium]|nr:LemA family protein [Candidatus Collierbacteria bacterium]